MDPLRNLSAFLGRVFRKLGGLFPRGSRKAAHPERAPAPQDEEWLELEGQARPATAPSRAAPVDLKDLIRSRPFILASVLIAGISISAISIASFLSRPIPSMPVLGQGVDLELMAAFGYPELPLPYAGMEALRPEGLLPPGMDDLRSSFPLDPDAIAAYARKGRAELDAYLEHIE